MKFKEQLAVATGLPKEILPTSYQAIGDICLLKLRSQARPYAAEIGQAILSLYPRFKTVCELEQIAGQFRRPKIRVIAGNGTETIHKEYSALYKLDVSKVMWSKGNLYERQRIASQIKPNELVLDMFAGVGYFTIQIALHAKPKRVYAIELNPIAFAYLEENIRLNRLSNIIAIQGDCRKIVPKLGIEADRIIMGYIPTPRDALPAAMTAAKDGTILHYESILRTHEKLDFLFKDVQNAAAKVGLRANLLNFKRVKKYGPHNWHVALDIKLQKLS